MQTGRVVGVVDGDTLTVQTERQAQLRIRLHAIDSPERGQPYSDPALRLLADLVANRTIRFETVDTDSYGRSVARVYVGDTDVNAELVRQGAAWVYRKYSDDPALLELEREARESKRGLWALPASQRVPPWEYRASERSAPAKRSADFVCGRKTYCKEMRSCAEARFHLETCGLARLDGDGDGVPCSRLCK